MNNLENCCGGAVNQSSSSMDHPKLEIVLTTDSELNQLQTEGESDDGMKRSVTFQGTEGDDVGDEENPGGTERNLDRFLIKPITGMVTPIANVGEKVGLTVVEHVGYVIPKIEKIPWIHFIILSFLVAIPAASYIIGFTKLGYGISTLFVLSRYFEQHAYILAISLAGFALVLYLFDFHHWKSRCGLFTRYLAISIFILGTAVLVCFISSTHPYGPISMYVVLTPMWLVLTKHLFYSHLEMRTYVPWLSGPLFFNAMVILSLWLWWTFSTNAHGWTEASRLADAQVSGCVPNFEEYPQCEVEKDRFYHATLGACFEVNQYNPELPKPTEECPEQCFDIYDDCPNIFIVWVGPFLVSLGLFFLSFFATFLKATGTIEQEILKFAKIWFFLLFALWIASSLSGVGAGVSITLAALTLSAFVASTILLAASFTHTERKEKVFQMWMSLVEKYRSYLNVAKGLLVVTSSPVFILYLVISFINQSIRNIKKACCERSPKTNSESLRNVVGEGYFTNEARRLIREIKSWDLVEVFTYANYWGMGFILFTVIAPQFTTLLLSWIIEQTSSMSIPQVTGILLAVGVIMFLLPPVPGAPIYLTFGVVIVPVGRDTWGIPYSILYAMGVSLVLKLFATFLQQKMIGGLLKGKVGIRQAVGINTNLIRAFKLVLSERGLGLAKVSILCGGPDWPTSVLCGVMDLSLMPVLVGTIPVLALIAPTVLAGSFTYLGSLELEKGQPEFSWAGTANTLSLAVAAVVLFGFMLLAAYYVEQTIRERKDEIDAIPIDEEVKRYDDEQEASNEAFKEVTQWHLVPWFARFILLLALFSVITSCYMMQIFYDSAFTAYQLTYTIDEHLDGDWKNLVKPLGSIALLLFAATTVLQILFNAWAKRVARQKLEENEKKKEEELELRSFGSNPPPSPPRAEISKTKSLSKSQLSHIDTDLGLSIYATKSL